MESYLLGHGGAPQFLTTEESFRSSQITDLDPMPCIGGFILKRIERGGKIYLCGSRGLLIQERGKNPYLTVAGLVPSEVQNSPTKLIKEAYKFKIESPLTPARLKALLRHPNPWVRVRAIEEAGEQIRAGDSTGNGVNGYTSVIGSAIGDSFLRVRLMAAYLLAESNDRKAIKPLQAAVKDSDTYVRAIAVMSLAKQGTFLPLSYYEEILTHSDEFGNLPWGVATIGVVVDEEDVYPLLAPRADKEVFRLFLKYPPNPDYIDGGEKMMADLGQAPKKHPDVAGLLLAVKGNDDGQVEFAREVFKYAGEDMLPSLHRALQSKERVIRSNAARACGAINDPSSVPFLIKALELESGLSRASIVWALGEIKAQPALPSLIRLYIDARNDEKSHSGSGFRSGQMRAALNSEYESLSNLQAIGTEWDELKASLIPGPLEPSYDEELLSPRDILEAIRKIGRGGSQEFYRVLAGDRETTARNEAAIGLSEGSGGELEKNLPVLRGLLGDEHIWIRMDAAVSLLILGQDQTKNMILQWLDSSDFREKGGIVVSLQRVKDPAMLVFAREKIEAIEKDDSIIPVASFAR